MYKAMEQFLMQEWFIVLVPADDNNSLHIVLL